MANHKKATTADLKPVIAIVRWRESADMMTKEQIRSFDFASHDARHGFLRFTTWAISRGYPLTINPGKISE